MSVFYDLNKTPRNILNQAIVRAIVSENNGLLFDIGDMSTMYQDAAGTTPVTAVEQPVGLILDKSQGLMLGPELVSNGAFDSDTSWVKGAGWAISGGNALCDGTQTATSLLYQTALTVGRCYQIEYDVIVTAGTMSVRPGSLGADATISISGHKIQRGLCFGNSILQIRANVGFIGSIDNISVREIYGNHAMQSITASRPVLSARYNLGSNTSQVMTGYNGWSGGAAGTINSALAPDGTMTASTVTAQAWMWREGFGGAYGSCSFAIYARAPSGTSFQTSITIWNAGTATKIASEIITVTDVWKRFIVSGITTSGTSLCRVSISNAAGGINPPVGSMWWGYDVRVGADMGPYQRVNTNTDYDTDERYFPKYLRFDGIDDYLNLPYMGLYAAGACTVICGISTAKPTSDKRIVAEGNSGSDTANYLPLSHMSTDGGVYQSSARNDSAVTSLSVLSNTIDTSKQNNIVSVVDTGSFLSIFKNSALSGSGSYVRNTPVTLNTTSIGVLDRLTDTGYFSGNLYNLTITKSALSDAQRIQCERLLTRKAGVTL